MREKYEIKSDKFFLRYKLFEISIVIEEILILREYYVIGYYIHLKISVPYFLITKLLHFFERISSYVNISDIQILR